MINCVAGTTPKKDYGQSLLQVALKSGNIEIADYLVESGIDVNFMEAEDEDPGLRAPVLFDAITAIIDSLCIGQYCTKEEIDRRILKSDEALNIMKKMLFKGADVNRRSSNGLDAINWSLHCAELIMGHPSLYPYSQDKVREQLSIVLDCLIENGIDYKVWLDGGYYPEPSPGQSIRTLFFDAIDIESEKSDNNEEYIQIKIFLQNFFKARNLICF